MKLTSKTLAIGSILGLLALNIFLAVQYGDQNSNLSIGLKGQVSDVTGSRDQADISITTRGPEQAMSGETIDYTLVVTNNGPADASITLVDPLSFGICGDKESKDDCVTSDSRSADCSASGPENGIVCELKLAAGETATQTASTTMQRLSSGLRVSTTATVNLNGRITDPNTSNNTYEWNVEVVDDLEATGTAQEADLEISLSGPDTATTATAAEYAIILANNGPSRAEVTVQLVADKELTFSHVSRSSDPNFTCKQDSASGDVYCNMTLEPGQSTTNGIWYDFGNTGEGSSATLKATISSDLRDPDLSSNDDEWVVFSSNR